MTTDQTIFDAGNEADTASHASAPLQSGQLTPNPLRSLAAALDSDLQMALDTDESDENDAALFLMEQRQTLKGLTRAYRRETRAQAQFRDADGYISAMTNPNAAASLLKMKNLQEQMETLQNVITQLEKQEASNKRKASEMEAEQVALAKRKADDDLKRNESAEKAAANYFKRIPTVAKLTADANEIVMISSFVTWCEANIPQALRTATVHILLASCMKEDLRGDHFLAQLIAHPQYLMNQGDLNWLKGQFIIFMRGDGYKARFFDQMSNCALGIEKPQVWRARLLDACSVVGMDIHGPTAASREMIQVWAERLPPNLQNRISEQLQMLCEDSTRGSVVDFVDLVIRNMPNIPDQVAKPVVPCGFCFKELVVLCDCSTMTHLKMSVNESKGQRKQANPKPASEPVVSGKAQTRAQRFQEARDLGLCSQCGGKWEKGHKEVCTKRKGAVHASMVASNPSIASSEERHEEWLENILDGAVLGATMALSGHSSPEETLAALRVTGTLTLQGKQCKGLHMDTLSDYSYMVAPFATRVFGSEEQWRAALKQAQPPAKVACGNNGQLVTMGALDVEVKGDYGPPFIHRFYLLPRFPANIYCIVGMDLMDVLGVKLKNVPSGKKEDLSLLALAVGEDEPTPEVSSKDLHYSLLESCRLLEDSNKSDDNYSDLLYTYRKRLEEKVAPALQRNSELRGFCIHPQAEIKFDTSDETPVKSHPYAIPHSMQEHVDAYFTELLEGGVIEKEVDLNHSLLSVLVVAKRDIAGNIKGWRPCLDPRKINVKIADPIYPLPLAENIFDKLKGKRIFSVLDLKSGFNQIKVRSSDRKKTAFRWRNNVYHYVGAPFGFKNIPQDFQQIMDRIFTDMDFVLVYIDDLIVASDSHEEHARHVQAVIERLNEVNLRANKDKCLFAYDKLVVLGNTISQEGQQVAVEKLLKMDSWQTPTSLKMLQRQLGFLNYFRGYIPKYSHLMAPIEELRSQGNKIKWLPEHSAIMAKVRSILEHEILLAAPDYSKPLFVGTDASKYGVAAVLFQKNEDGSKSYIRMASRSLIPSETHYGAPQRELRAVLEALRWFRVYLWGRKFTVYTDHQALVYMLSREKISPVVENWMHEILSFNIHFEHIPGIENHLPDALSRFYDDDPRIEEKPDYVALMGSMVIESLPQLQDTWVERAPVYNAVDASDNEAVIADKVYTEVVTPEELQIIESKEMQKEIIERAHIHGHIGAGDMVRLIKSSKRAIWPNMFRDCQDRVSSCVPCQRYNVGVHGYHPPKNLKALLPFDHVCIDLKEMPSSRKGNKYILVMVDVATRFTFLSNFFSSDFADYRDYHDYHNYHNFKTPPP